MQNTSVILIRKKNLNQMPASAFMGYWTRIKWRLTCGVVVCLPWRLDAVVVVMSLMEGDVSERLPVAEALD